MDSPAIKIVDFSLKAGKRFLLRDVSTDFRRGALTALIGRNGAGKSTLLRAIAGLNTGYSGTIFVEGDDLRRLKPLQLASRIAFVNTERVRIQNMRCRDVVATGRSPYTNWIGHMRDSDREAVQQALETVGMTEFADRTLDKMSDGECQRVMIARALAQDTPVILLDEPTSFLDMPSRFELARLLSSLAREKGKCVVFSTHELDIAAKFCDFIALINEEKLINLPPETMIAQGIIARTFNI